MSEQAPNPNHERDIDYESHRDETAYVRQRLTRLMDQGTPFAAGGEGLYVSMPGKIYGGRNYIDKGCRGGWSESYEAALGDEPAELSLIRRRYNKLHLRLAGGGSTTLTPDEIAQANFLVDPARWHSDCPTAQPTRPSRPGSAPHPMYRCRMMT